MVFFFSQVLKNKVAVLAFFGLTLVWSLTILPQLSVDAVPDITNTQVVVISRTGALTPDQIEKRVTLPIEQEMTGLKGVTEVRSLTKFGLSLVTVIFEDGTPLYFARQIVGEKLVTASTSLPEGVQTGLAPVATGLGEVLMWTVRLSKDSEKRSWPLKEQLQYLRAVQDRKIRPQLKQIDGIAEVDLNGGYNREVHINYFPDKLKVYGVTVTELARSVQSAGEAFSGGYIQQNNQQVIVKSSYQLETLDQLKALAVKIMPNGKLVRVGDLADVRFDHSQRTGAASQMGEETVLGIALMRVGANSRAVASLAEQSLKDLNLPKDIVLEIAYNRSDLVQKTVGTIEKNLLEGALLVIVVLFLLLGRFLAALIVACVIPISMIYAVNGMFNFGISANLMSLGAIDFGLLVDGSVVFVENIIKRLSEAKEKLNPKQRLQIISEACSEVAPPVIVGLVIIMVVYLPIFTLEGVEGKMFSPMATTVLMALGASLIVALFLIPVLAYLLIRTPEQPIQEPFLARWLHKIYPPILDLALRFPKLLLSSVLLVFLVGSVLFLRIGSEFVPQLDEGDLVLGIVREPKQHLDTSLQEQLKLESAIKEFPEVELVFSRIGSPESGTDPMSPNFADTFVILKKGVGSQKKDELFEAIRKRLLELNPEQEISKNQPIEMRFNEILEGSRADVSLRILGPDLDELLKLATQAKDILGEIDGVESVEFDALTGLTKTDVLSLKVDSERAQQLGINIQDLNMQFETALAGVQLGSFVDNGFRIPVRLHLDESLRDQMSMIEQIPVSIQPGTSVPLKDVVSFGLKEEVTTIARYFSQRYSAVSINLQDRDIGSFVQEAKQKIKENLPLPDGYKIAWGGQFKNLERARGKLMFILPLTLGIVFFLLFFMTGSFIQAAIIFTAVPVGLAGGAFSLAARDINFSVSAAIGFIALSGIVVLNSMVLVSFINQLRAHGETALNAVKNGAMARLMPVSITALVASLGFLPMALNTGLGAEVQRPLATVVIGGLVTSTVLTLLVVPVLMRWSLERDGGPGRI